MITFLFLIIGAYIFGSIPWGYILCRSIKKIDIRDYGSGNIGATNVYRIAGGWIAVLVLALDTIKGLFPVLTAKKFSLSLLQIVAIGIASVIGHSFSIFLKGKGGKGVSTSFGVIIGLFPLPALFAFILWASVIIITSYVSAGAIISAITLPLFIFLFQRNFPQTLTGIVVCLLIIYTHRTNIRRLFKKEENKIKLPWLKK